MVKHTAVTTSFNMKNCTSEQKFHDKKGSRVKKCPICKNMMKNAGCVNGTIEITLE